ncbi:hypothetical protein [Kitasatospora sp. NPDC091276]|uniref:hypothetical protein n=1 Tax=Kitasatospora sp. NPDC091276 TaxID=3155300 RepID=UPI00341A7B38
MTRYSIDPHRRELIATWGTGEGDLATCTATLPSEADLSAALGLARVLTQLSQAAWHTYTHPASAASSLAPNTEGWRREEERKAFAEVAEAIANPNLPSGGSMVVSYSRVIESANRVGRVLHELSSPELTKAVLAEATTELAAVENAELGDLADRAQQAVLLSREDASPVQVAAADRLLQQDPFGPAELFSAVDPTAAAVAAAHWLAAAAEVTAEASGHDAVHVVQEADNIEALAHETPTLVLGLIADGATPYEAVTGLVRHAMHITDGLLPDPAAFREQLDELEETLAEYSVDDGPDVANIELRLTPLDPTRPARDLLEDLLTGIYACWLLHSEYDDLDNEDDADTDDVEDWTDEQAEQHQQRSRDRFALLVRESAARRDPLI